MSKKKRKQSFTNPDLRRQIKVPSPPCEEIEQQLWKLLQPKDFTPMHLMQGKDEKKLRARVLTLPVMMAVVVSLVYRQITGIREVIRVLSQEGLMWVEPMDVSPQALSKRLQTLPVGLFAQIWEQVIERIRASERQLPIPQGWSGVHEKFSALWIADASTLEELRKKLKALQGTGTVLGGKMMMVVEAFSHRLVKSWYTEDAKANEKTFCDQLLAILPKGGLLIFDLGFFKFAWFDEFTNTDKFFVTRFREKTAYRVVRSLSSGPSYRDEIIQMGLHHTNPSQHQVRLVSVLWGKSWYHYLTNVLDPTVLSAQQICDLYRRRWRIEDAFNLTKRLLGLAYLWVGDRNGVQIQMFATWIFYAVLNELSADVAIALKQPLEISLEMVFRGLYHFARALLRGDASDMISYFVSRHKLLGSNRNANDIDNWLTNPNLFGTLLP